MGAEAKQLVKFDKWGYQVKTSSHKCISAINDFYDQVLSYGRKRSVILEAPLHDEQCVLANILAAHFLSSTKSSELASSFFNIAKSHYGDATAYEKMVFDAISHLISEDRNDHVALELHFKLLREFPRDLASLERAQVLCFYMGQPNLSLDLVQQVLPENEQEAYIYGMLSFPLLELNHMEEAERAARKALEINKQDSWAQHNLCHVLQYTCRFDEAIKFMEECSPYWNSRSSSRYTHNWWHLAACYLEAHAQVKRVLDVYDHCIIKELDRPDASHPEVYLNALGLLMKLHVRDEINLVEDRLRTLAARLADQVTWYAEWHLDLFILWALASTNHLSAAQELLKGLSFRVSNMNKNKQQQMQRGLLLAEAMYEYGMGNNEQAVSLLGSEFNANDFKAIGASDEQLFVFNEVWYSLLLKTGQAKKAIEVIERRLEERKSLPFLRDLLEKAYLMIGRGETTGKTEVDT